MYDASKLRDDGLGGVDAPRAAPFGVRVHVVEPGMVDTDFPSATTPTGALARGEGPYVPLFAELRAGFRIWREEMGVGGEDVAAAIIAAALDPQAPFCTPVGTGRDPNDRARAELSDEDFQAWQMRLLGITWGQEPASP